MFEGLSPLNQIGDRHLFIREVEGLQRPNVNFEIDNPEYNPPLWRYMRRYIAR